MPFLLMQGLGVGVVSCPTYAFAIRHIGDERASTMGSLSPALTAVLAAALLHEPLGAIMLGALSLSAAASCWPIGQTAPAQRPACSPDSRFFALARRLRSYDR